MARVFCNLPNEQLTAAEWRAIDKRVQPSEHCCKWGMVAPGETVGSVIGKDRVALKRLGITSKQMAAALHDIVREKYDDDGGLCTIHEQQFTAAGAKYTAAAKLAEAAANAATNDTDRDAFRAEWSENTRLAQEAGAAAIGMPLFSMYPDQPVHVPQKLYSYTRFLNSVKLPNPIKVQYLVGMDAYCMDAQVCPFKNKNRDSEYHGARFGNLDVIVVNQATGEYFTFNTLLIHMMAAHEFYEGTHILSEEGKLVPNPWRFDIEKAYSVIKDLVDRMPAEGDKYSLPKYTSYLN